MDMNKLSYRAYGNIVVIVIICMAIIFTLFPFSFIGGFSLDYIINFLIYFSMLPIYLSTRSKYGKPIHAIGLNLCFFLTTSFYFLLYLFTYFMIKYSSQINAFILSSVFTSLATYFTSEITNDKEEKGKLFFGFKKKNEPSKYKALFDYLKYNAITDEYIEAENKLKAIVDSETFIIYKRIFKENQTWSRVEEELDVNRNYIIRAVDKCYFYMVGRLEL